MGGSTFNYYSHLFWFQLGAVLRPKFYVMSGSQNESKLGDFCVCDSWMSTTWNPKQPFINGCFNWMIPNLYIGNGCFTKHLFINGCLGFQACISGFRDGVDCGSRRVGTKLWPRIRWVVDGGLRI